MCNSVQCSDKWSYSYLKLYIVVNEVTTVPEYPMGLLGQITIGQMGFTCTERVKPDITVNAATSRWQRNLSWDNSQVVSTTVQFTFTSYSWQASQQYKSNIMSHCKSDRRPRATPSRVLTADNLPPAITIKLLSLQIYKMWLTIPRSKQVSRNFTKLLFSILFEVSL